MSPHRHWVTWDREATSALNPRMAFLRESAGRGSPHIRWPTTSDLSRWTNSRKDSFTSMTRLRLSAKTTPSFIPSIMADSFAVS